MRRDTAEYRSLCINHNQHHPNYVHGDKPEVDAKPNGTTGLNDCKCPTARTDDTYCRNPF